MEASIFDYINSILFDKRYIDDIKYEEGQFNVFMCNRWISMYSDVSAEIINETTNKYWPALTSKEDQYNFLYNIFPKFKRKRIEYIKKHKEDKAEKKETIDIDSLLAQKYQISKREVQLYKNIYESK
jgi:hypothetical protein